MIVFEELSIHLIPHILFYVLQSKKIFFIRIHKNYTHKTWFRNVLNWCGIIELGMPPLYEQKKHSYGFNFDEAYDAIEHYYHFFKTSKVIQRLKVLYQSDDIELTFKKPLHLNLSRFFYFIELFDYLNAGFPNQRIHFIPGHGTFFFRTDRCEIVHFLIFKKLSRSEILIRTRNVSFSKLAMGAAFCRAYFRKAVTLFQMAAGLGWIMVQATAKKRAKLAKDEYGVAFMLTSPERPLPFHIKDAVCISYQPLSKTQYRIFSKDYYEVIDDLDSYIFWRDILKILPMYLKCLFSIFEYEFILNAALKDMYSYLRWSGLSRKIKIKNMISFCDPGIQACTRNIILKQHGARTIYYMESANYGCILSKNGSPNLFRVNLHGFVRYDTFIAWNDLVPKYFAAQQATFNQIVNVGCLWSENIRNFDANQGPSSLKQRVQEKGIRGAFKIISVFDTSFDDHSLITYADGFKFLEDILKLLEIFPNIFILYKEKKVKKYHMDLTSLHQNMFGLYSLVANHPRALFLEAAQSVSEMISLSDLTISMAFTSPSYEALSFGRRGIWHDPLNKFRAAYYSQIPGLVSHSYGELVQSVKDLLWDTKDDQYRNYLEKEIRGKLENYLDGRALTRFQKVITEDRF